VGVAWLETKYTLRPRRGLGLALKRWEKDVANANFRVLTPDYFKVTGTRLLRGRCFDEQDDADHPNVAIINRTMARLFWPNESPLGKRIRLGALSGQTITLRPDTSPWATVVGVVDDAKQIRIIDAPVRQEMFFPMYQRGALRGITLMLRSELGEAMLTDEARQAIQNACCAVCLSISIRWTRSLCLP
jgi:hypothetical protein